MRIPSRILLAPDSFKGTFSATQVAEAMEQGLSEAGWSADLCPVADGGEGTQEALLRALGGRVVRAPASDALGRRIEAQFGLSRVAGQLVGVVETACASGLSRLTPDELDPLSATSYGTGELIVAAARAGAQRVYVGAGGSATTDGGSGALRAIREAGGLAGAALTVLCDVRTPFERAAAVFAAQKGAGPREVRSLTARLGRLARSLPRDPRGLPLTGAAGGLAGGLWAGLGAELVPGAPFVLDRAGFEGRLRAARAVVTGEGALDQQSLAGKAVSEVATRARQNGVPCHAIVGRQELDRFGLRILDLQAVLEAGSLRRIRSAAARLTELI